MKLMNLNGIPVNKVYRIEAHDDLEGCVATISRDIGAYIGAIFLAHSFGRPDFYPCKPRPKAISTVSADIIILAEGGGGLRPFDSLSDAVSFAWNNDGAGTVEVSMIVAVGYPPLGGVL